MDEIREVQILHWRGGRGTRFKTHLSERALTLSLFSDVVEDRQLERLRTRAKHETSGRATTWGNSGFGPPIARFRLLRRLDVRSADLLGARHADGCDTVPPLRHLAEHI
jgi:hypothetical protein